MAGMPVYGNDPYSYGGTNPNPNAAPKYRSDAGSSMTDAQYTAWKQQQPLKAQQAQTDIQTAAQKALADQQYQFGTAASKQQNQWGVEAADKQNQWGTDARKQAAGFASDTLKTQNQFGTAARDQAAAIAANQAKTQNDYATQMRVQQESLAEQQAKAEAALASGAATQQFGFQTQGRTQEADLQAVAEQRRLASLQGLMQGFGGVGGGGAGGGTAEVPYSGGGGGAIGGEAAANDAALARAKDVAGQTGRSALTALNETMGARGLTGSGIATGQTAGVINQGAQQIGDVNREQLIQQLAANRQRASEQYQGQIAQRGQNINAQQGYLSSLMGLMNARY